MLIYKNRWFDRWARKQGLTDLNLCAAVNEMAAGLYEVDLGGGLFKKRIARSSPETGVGELDSLGIAFCNFWRVKDTSGSSA